jgi:hypothetical protein
MSVQGADSCQKHDSDWSVCEETSSEYGRQRAGQKGYRPNPKETNCYKSNQAHRYVMRNKDATSSIFRS